MPGRRTPKRVGLSSALVACCLTTQDAGSFVLAPPVETNHHVAMSMSMSTQKPLARAELLRAATIGAGVVGAAVFRPVRSEAALPTAEDYAFGTGSKVCVSAAATKFCVCRVSAAMGADGERILPSLSCCST